MKSLASFVPQRLMTNGLVQRLAPTHRDSETDARESGTLPGKLSFTSMLSHFKFPIIPLDLLKALVCGRNA